MTSPTRSIVFRVTGLGIGKAEEITASLTATINQHLSQSESQLRYLISPIPSCDDEHTSAALVDFKDGVPVFLNRLVEDPLADCPIETDDGDITFDRHFFGFTQLYYPDSARSVDMDIVAITGLDGHAYGSWRGKGDLARMWLRDFLSKDLPTCRTMIYGYNSKLLCQGIDTIMTYTLEFMEGLKRVRKTQELRQRPIVFIAHSFGGIILTNCLVKVKLADENDHLSVASLWKATYGILFFATPHKGLMIDDLRSMIEGTENHPRNILLDQINSKSDFLVTQLVNFKNMVHDRKIISFFETEQTRSLEWDPKYQRWGRTGSYITAVDTDSANLQLPSQTESLIPLHSDHSKIVKFDSKNALGYKVALEKLNEFVADALNVVSQRFCIPSGIGNSYEVNKDNKPQYIVPFNRDPRFVGREDVIQDMNFRFETRRRVALYGIGGIGKSQVAIEYCYLWKEHHQQSHVFWVHASTRARFEQAYKGIARDVSIPGSEDPMIDTLTVVRDWLNKPENGSWLLVLDNADNLDLFFGPDPSAGEPDAPRISELLPHGPNGFVLITTRDRRIGQRLADDGGVIMIPPLAPLDAEQLLRCKIPNGDNMNTKEIQSLLEILGFIPLAIAQAAAFIQENDIAVAIYVRRLQGSDSDLQDYLDEDFPDPRRDPRSENSIIRTWRLSFDQILKQTPRAAELLSLMAMLDRQGIPETLLKQENDRTIEFEKAIGTLKAYSLITTERGGSSFEVHRLVQLSTLKWLRLQGNEIEWQEKALQLMVEKFPSGEYGTWQECESLLPHAKAVTTYSNSSEVLILQLAKLVQKLARYDVLQGRFDVAYLQYKEVLQKRDGILGKKHPDTLTSINNLALVLDMQGKYNEAEAMNRQALELEVEVLGKKHPDTLASMNNLAFVLDSQGKYNEAEAMHQQVLELSEEVLGKKHPDTLTSISYLALVLERQGKYSKAEAMHQQVLKLREEVLGKKHPDTLISMSNLALVLDSQGKYNEAEAMHRQALELREEVLGKKHPDTLISMSNLASVLYSQGKYNEAEAMHRQAVKLSEEVLGKTHPNTLTSINNLALVLDSQGKYNEAEAMHRQALELSGEVLGKKHPSTLASMSNLALVLDSQGKYNKAKAMHQQALKLSEEVLGKKHPSTLTSMSNLALVLDSQGKYNKAKAMHQQALKLREEVLGKKHPNTLASMNNLALVLNSQGKYNEAEAMHRQALELSEEALSKKHPDTLTSMSNLASALYSQGKYDEAEVMHRQALELSEEVLGKKHPDTLTSVYCLAILLHKTDRYKEASIHYDRACTGYKQTLGLDHPTTVACVNHYATMIAGSDNISKRLLERESLRRRRRVDNRRQIRLNRRKEKDPPLGRYVT